MKRRARSDIDASLAPLATTPDAGDPAPPVRGSGFETVADRAPALIWTSSPDGGLVYANDSWLEFTGLDLDGQVGDGWLATVHPDDVESWRRLAASADRRRGFELELRVRRADGEHRWMHVRAAPSEESDGTFAGWVVSSFDLTEERALNDVLRRRERRQAAVADLGHAALLGRDVDGLLEDATHVVAELFDVDVAAALELLPAGDEFLVRAAYGFATARAGMRFPIRSDTPAGITLATAGPVAFDDLRTDTRFAPGTAVHDLGVVSGLLVPIRGRDQPFGVLAAYATRYRPFVEDDIVFLRNIANVVAAAVLRHRAELELLSREAEARLALDAGDMGSWLWDPRTGSMTWSPELERLCGLEPGTFPATFRAFVDMVHPDDREATLQAMAEAEARGDLVTEYRIVRPDGTVRWVEGRGRPLPEGPPARWIGVALDVTDRRHADDELRRLLEVERRVSAEAARAQERLRLLARVGELVTVELDSTARLDRVARLVLPTFADCCSVYVHEPDGRARLCAFAHVDPEAQTAFDASGELPVLAADSPAPPAVAMRTGEPALLPEVPGSLVTQVLTSAEALHLASETAIRSILAVPLAGPEGTIGALVFAYAGSGRHYGDDDVPIAQEIARRVAPALENAFRFEREQATAEILQRSLLPEELPTVDDVELTARYLPGTAGVKIGGDWYDVVDMGPGRLVLAIGDVVGHGVRAAAAMGKLRHALQLFALEGLAPARILERLNAYVCADSSGDMATLLVMVYSQETGTLRFASAGHPPPLVREFDGALTYLPGGRGMPLGASTVAEYVEDHVQLAPGSVLVMYTDGLVERRREPLDVGFLRLGEALSHAPDDLDAIADHLLHALLETGGPRDDVALLVTRPMPAPEAVDLTLPTRPQELAPLRRTIGSWLTRVGATPAEVFETTLSVNEIAANAIEHAYGVEDATFHVEARLDDGGVVFVVRDSGQWREPRAVGDRGRGLQIVQTLMHDVDVRRTAGGTQVTMRRQLHHMERQGTKRSSAGRSPLERERE